MLGSPGVALALYFTKSAHPLQRVDKSSSIDASQASIDAPDSTMREVRSSNPTNYVCLPMEVVNRNADDI
ncbi:hypothetical protein GCM10009651_32720 [Microbacterium natoriense]